MMRPEESEPVCIVNGCGRSTLHRIGECAPDDAPTYSDGAEVQARVDAVMGDALTDAERDALLWTLPPGERSRHVPSSPLFAAVARIVAVRTSAAVKQAQADERARIVRRVEFVLSDRRSVYGDGSQVDALTHNIRAALARGGDL